MFEGAFTGAFGFVVSPVWADMVAADANANIPRENSNVSNDLVEDAAWVRHRRRVCGFMIDLERREVGRLVLDAQCPCGGMQVVLQYAHEVFSEQSLVE